jgi:hypothetical protein
LSGHAAGRGATRRAYLDWLKVLLVGLMIVWHGVAGYMDLESAWPYQDVQEVGRAELSNNLLATLALPGVPFAMRCCARRSSCARERRRMAA